MPAFIEEKATMELRYRRVWYPVNGFNKAELVLQQKWLVTTGGTGDGVKYAEVWRDVEIVDSE